MNYAILDASSVVINIAVADESWEPGEGLTKREATAGCEIGGRWAGSGWESKPILPVPVPEAITPLQARRALLAAGLLDDVETMIAQAPREARLAWEYAVEIYRNDPTLVMLATSLGLTSDQIDDLFRSAAEIV